LTGVDVTDIVLGKLVDKREQQQKQIAPAKIIERKTIPSFMPGEICLDGSCQLDGVHANKNYSLKPAKKCSNCAQFAPKGTKKMSLV
jgi:hypothetical protein